jgi:DNA invertase Pin-like site-specific DNA recombinase
LALAIDGLETQTLDFNRAATKNFVKKLVLAELDQSTAEKRKVSSEKIRQGIQTAKAKGVKMGRPKKGNHEKLDEVAGLHKSGLSQRLIGKKLGLAPTTVHRIKMQAWRLGLLSAAKPELDTIAPL